MFVLLEYYRNVQQSSMINGMSCSRYKLEGAERTDTREKPERMPVFRANYLSTYKMRLGASIVTSASYPGKSRFSYIEFNA